MRGRPAGVAVVTVLTAALAAWLPMPPVFVERYYSTGVYPLLQGGVTGLSNLVPVALFDIVGFGLAACVLVILVLAVRQGPRLGWGKVMARALILTATIGAAGYLVFLGVWGLNYRRVPIVQKIAFDPSAVTAAAAVEFAHRVARELNATYEPAHAAPSGGDLAELSQAFASAQRALGVKRPARPARPKSTLLDPYFRATAVEGMTNPFFLETLVVSSLLDVERPFVVAHEWSHLAGFADEGEANFVGWLTCMAGSAAERYSGWLFLYRETVARLGDQDRADVARALSHGPRADLQAIVDRRRRHVNLAMSRVSWQAYDRYLRANRVEAGAASYADVVKLVLGATFEDGWTPLLR